MLLLKFKKIIQFFLALFVCTIALFLPYRLRIYWFSIVSFIVHLPFKIFGNLSHFLLKHIGEENEH